MRTHRLRLTTLAIPALFALSGCVNEAAETGDDGTVVKATEAFGESGCPTTPDQSFAGLIPAPGITTPTTYSNPHCYKSYVASVSTWPSQRAELVVTDFYNTSAEWYPLTGRERKTAPPPALSQTDCQNLFLDVVVYENGVRMKQLAKGGAWTTLANGSLGCERPTMILGGLKRAFDIIDTIQFTPGNSYTFAATYRTSDSSAAATLPFKILTPSLRCGLIGQGCCTGRNDVKPFTCEDGSTCTALNTCAACGSPGLMCCDIFTSGTFDDCPGLSQCVSGTCSN
jgi:hypothetical protein